MRIIITQAEIEEAIAQKVLSQMSINDHCELKINLQATRGEEGYTATIDVVEKVEEEPIKMPSRRGRAAAAKPAEPTPRPQEDPVQEDPADTPEEAQDSSEDSAPAEDAPKTGSIFANLRKPVNEPADA